MYSEKDFLLAHMAAVRARLLHDLIGIEEVPLLTSLMYGDWTPAMLLAHLGEYDQFYAVTAQCAAEGKLTHTVVDYSDIRDHKLRERVGTWSLEQCVNLLMSGRSHYVKTFRNLPEEALKKKHHFDWKFGDKTGSSSGTIRTWTKWRFQHDAGHMKDITDWRKTQRETYMIGSKTILLATMAAANDDFQSSAALVAADERETRKVCGEWTLTQLLGHLADWDIVYLSQLYAMIGKPFKKLKVDDSETATEATNARFIQARTGQTYEAALKDATNARKKLLAELTKLDETTLADIYGGDYSGYPTPYHLYWSALEHYLQHAADIRAALAVHMPKYLLSFKGPFTE
jgi:hypothetical protein